MTAGIAAARPAAVAINASEMPGATTARFAEPFLVVLEHVIDDLGDPGDFLMRGDVELRERALAQLLRRGHHDRWSAPLAERAQERDGLPPHASELPPLVDDERPAHDRKDAEQGEHRLGDGACL